MILGVKKLELIRPISVGRKIDGKRRIQNFRRFPFRRIPSGRITKTRWYFERFSTDAFFNGKRRERSVWDVVKIDKQIYMNKEKGRNDPGAVHNRNIILSETSGRTTRSARKMDNIRGTLNQIQMPTTPTLRPIWIGNETIENTPTPLSPTQETRALQEEKKKLREENNRLNINNHDLRRIGEEEKRIRTNEELRRYREKATQAQEA